MRLELNSQPHLALAPWQELQSFSQRYSHTLELFHPRRVRSIQQIEELDNGLNAHSFTDDKSLGEPHVQIDIAGRLEVVAAGQKIHAIQNAIAVYVGRGRRRPREMETALRPEDAADFESPR